MGFARACQLGPRDVIVLIDEYYSTSNKSIKQEPYNKIIKIKYMLSLQVGLGLDKPRSYTKQHQ